MTNHIVGKLCANGHRHNGTDMSLRNIAGKCVACLAAATVRYKKSHPERIAKRKREYRVNNVDKVSAYEKEYYKANAEHIAEKNARYRSTPVIRAVDARANGKKRIVCDSDESFTNVEWFVMVQYFGEACAYCGGIFESIDHITPLHHGGSNTINNVVTSCRSCNRSKYLSPMSEWYHQQPFFSHVRLDKILNHVGGSI